MFVKLALKSIRVSPLLWGVILSIPVIPLIYILGVSVHWAFVAILIVYHITMLCILMSVGPMLSEITSSAHQLSQGDLTSRINKSQDSDNLIYQSFNRVGEDISRTTFFLGKTTRYLIQVANSLQSQSEASKSGAVAQQHNINSAKERVEQLSTISSQVDSYCNDSYKLATDASDMAEKGITGMKRLEDSLEATTKQYVRSAEHFEQLNQESVSIGQVIDTIGNIAEQTNLLALNAAIESARAGEHGRGFAVVADEVRALATQTQDATKQISEKILNLQELITKVNSSMESNKARILASQEAAGEAECNFNSLNEQILNIDTLGKNIADLASEQLSETKALDNYLKQIEQESNNNVGVAQKTVLASITVRNLAGEVESLLKRFVIDDKQVEQEDKNRDKLIEWGPDLDLGLTEINRQHETLVNLINELYYLLNNNYDLASVKRVVQGLIDYTGNHFKYEETLFDMFEYKDRHQHERIHSTLVSQVLDFQRRVESGEDISDELMSFLKAWLTQHIQKEDRAYSRLFKEMGM
ncbi:bacteriohemerythrin [Vibrio salinus]|uniref:bacteriohemerythrin n=1 Tax=Vibrio salinus TaxID=2899784 RepID=UPI001E5182D5|nr:bacteriohemerythrin [Vibrio salinus]MCE0495896.1 bacteriohemerythrin [Vibrio salinus]